MPERPVEFDAQAPAVGMRLVAQRQTDAIVAASHVPVDGPAALFQCARDRFLKRVGVAGVLRCSVERIGLRRGGLTALRKLQEIAKQPDARSRGLSCGCPGFEWKSVAPHPKHSSPRRWAPVLK